MNDYKETRAKRLFLGRTIGTLILACLGCSPSHGGADDSAILGKVTWLDQLGSPPPKKSPEELRSFGAMVLKEALTSGKQKDIPRSPSMQLLSAAYTHAVAEMGGVPREQGEQVLKELIARDSPACAGVSCAAIFDLSEDHVGSFFDQLLDNSAADGGLVRSVSAEKRHQIIRSLIPSKSFARQAESEGALAWVYLQKPLPKPSFQDVKHHVLEAHQIVSITGVDFSRMIYDYTTKSDFKKMRLAETMTPSTLVGMGIKRGDVAKLLLWSEEIQNGLGDLPIFPAPVYRGLQGLTAEDIGRWVQAWKAQGSLGLGPKDLPATTSASWDVYTATSFINSHLLKGIQSKEYAALLEINSHRGVSIESLSGFPGEREVLIPRDQKVIIESIAPLENIPRTFLIKMRGVDSAMRVKKTGNFIVSCA